MSASLWRCGVWSAAVLLAVAVSGRSLAAAPQPATINKWVEEVNARPRPDESKYRTAMTIPDLALPSDYRKAIREVVEWRLARMAKANPKGLRPAPPMDASPEEIRRLWRLSIVRDVQASVSPYFRQEVVDTLTPIATALALGYNDPKGRPDRAVRINAVLLLVRLPGRYEKRTEALLRLLRQKGVDEGSLFLIIRALGAEKIALAVPTLLGVLSGSNPVLSAAAARALGSIGDKAALKPLLRLLHRSGDTTLYSPHEADNLLLAIIEGITGVATVNELSEAEQAEVLAALMRVVLTDPDRVVVCAAVDAIRQIAAYPYSLKPTLPEEDFQRGIERLRRWWLKQKGAKSYYEKMFHLEPMEE